MIIYVDTVRGKLMGGLNGNDLSALTFFLRDIVEFDVVFIDGAGNNITSTLLTGDSYLNIAITAQPSVGPVLACASTYQLISGVAKTLFSFNIIELLEYFLQYVPNTVNECWMHLEIQVSAADNSWRQTYYQDNCLVKSVISLANSGSPTPVIEPMLPSSLLSRMDITTRAGGLITSLDYIPTRLLSIPIAAIIRPAGTTGELWCLDVWDGTTIADGVYSVDPLDKDPITNRRQWKRII